jgi:hypothetical protein
VKRVIPALLLAACTRTSPTPVDRAPPPVEHQAAVDPHAEFQAIARGLAEQSQRRILAWGTALLGEDGQPRRWARIEIGETGGDAEGTYLIEDRPGVIWAVHYTVDGRNHPEPDDGPPTWGASDARALVEYTAYHRGSEEVRFALRGGVPAVLAIEESSPDGDDTRIYAPDDGACAPAPCPALADSTTMLSVTALR